MSKRELSDIAQRAADEASALEERALSLAARAIEDARRLRFIAAEHFASAKPPSAEEGAAFSYEQLIPQAVSELWRDAARLRALHDAIEARLREG